MSQISKESVAVYLNSITETGVAKAKMLRNGYKISGDVKTALNIVNRSVTVKSFIFNEWEQFCNNINTTVNCSKKRNNLPKKEKKFYQFRNRSLESIINSDELPELITMFHKMIWHIWNIGKPTAKFAMKCAPIDEIADQMFVEYYNCPADYTLDTEDSENGRPIAQVVGALTQKAMYCIAKSYGMRSGKKTVDTISLNCDDGATELASLHIGQRNSAEIEAIDDMFMEVWLEKLSNRDRAIVELLQFQRKGKSGDKMMYNSHELIRKTLNLSYNGYNLALKRISKAYFRAKELIG